MAGFSKPLQTPGGPVLPHDVQHPLSQQPAGVAQLSPRSPAITSDHPIPAGAATPQRN